MRMIPRAIFILKQASSTTRRRETLTEKMATTWLLELTGESHTAPGVLQVSRQKTALPVTTQFDSEKTPATIEADQMFLTLQQLANNNNSSNLYNKIKKTSNLPKSLASRMLTFDGKSEKFELFEKFFQTIS